MRLKSLFLCILLTEAVPLRKIQNLKIVYRFKQNSYAQFFKYKNIINHFYWNFEINHKNMFNFISNEGTNINEFNDSEIPDSEWPLVAYFYMQLVLKS